MFLQLFVLGESQEFQKIAEPKNIPYIDMNISHVGNMYVLKEVIKWIKFFTVVIGALSEPV